MPDEQVVVLRKKKKKKLASWRPEKDLFPVTRTDEELRALVFEVARTRPEPFKALVAQLVGVMVDENSARVLWARFVTRRRELVTRLGRKVHLRAAAFDALSQPVTPAATGPSLSNQEGLWAAATTDPLTGLANRQLFTSLLTHELKQRSRKPVSIILIDLDGLEAVSALHGTSAGDALLKHAAALLQKVVRPGDVLARLGSDEFSLLLPATTLEQTRSLCTRVTNALKRGLKDKGASASVGFTDTTASDTAERMMGRASLVLDEGRRRRAAALEKMKDVKAARAAPVALYATTRPDSFYALHAIVASHGVLLVPVPSPEALKPICALLAPRLVLVHALFPPQGGEHALAELRKTNGKLHGAIVMPKGGWGSRAFKAGQVVSVTADAHDGALNRVLTQAFPGDRLSFPALSSAAEAKELCRAVASLFKGAPMSEAKVAALAGIPELDLLRRALGA